MRPIRLVIADRRPIVLQGFATLFAAERDFAIVASCLDGAGCLNAIRTLTPDLVLVEDGFADVTASDMLAVVQAENIPTRLVFYTASVAHGDLAAAIAAGSCCAISMREEPGTLMQSLRLVAPAAAGRETGAPGENGAATLTDQERKIMRLVAYGMSNKQIARELKLSTGTIKARLDHISTQLEIKSRTEIAAFALSRLYGGIGALAALIYAALDDVQPAHATADGHEPTETFKVMSADGSAELITIKVHAPKTPAAAKAGKSVVKVGRVESAIIETPARNSKAVQSSIDSAFSIITAAAGSARPAVSGFGSFMMTVVAVWICDLLNSVAQASHLADIPIVPASATGGSAGELAAVHSVGSPLGGSPGNIDVNLDSLAWWQPDTHHQAFAFGVPGSETIATNGDALQIVGAEAGDDSASSSGNPHIGSGSIDALTDQGIAKQTAATDTLSNTSRDKGQGIAGDESDPDQQQHGLHLGEDGGAAAKPHGNHGSAEDDSTHGQSQHALKSSTSGSDVAPQQQAKHAPHGHDSNHGQTQRDLHGSEDRPAAAEQHAKDNAKDQALDGSAQAHKPDAPELGDSFHFKTESAASGASHISAVHGGHAPYSFEHAPHTAGHDGLPPIQASDLVVPPGAEQIHQAQGAGHHLTHDHDLFV